MPESIVAPRSSLAVTLADVQAAANRIRGSVYCTPAPHSVALSALTGQTVFLKLDLTRSSEA